MRIPRIPLLAAAALALSLPATAIPVPPAGTPMLLQTAGRLLDGQDAPVSGPATLTFSIYPVGDDLPGHPATAPIWTATYDVVVQNGVYTVVLGETGSGGPALTSAAFDPREERWLGVSVNHGDEMRPRMRVGTVPFAAIATSALDAEKLGGQLPATYHDASLLTGTVPAAALDNALQSLTVSGALTAEKVGTNVALGLPEAGAAQTGALRSDDWARFDTAATTADAAKVTASTAVQAVTGAGPLTAAKNGTTVALGLAKSTATQDGYLAAADFALFANGAIADSRLSANIARQNAAATFTGVTVTGGKFTGDGSGLTNLVIPDGSVSAAKLGDSGCAPGQYLRRNSADTAWECADQAPAGPWTRVSFDNFEANAGAWTPATRVSCRDGYGFVLGPIGAGVEAAKTISNLPPHKTLRVVARYHMIDSWDFERGYLKVDGVETWAQSHSGASNANDSCGGPYPDRMGVPVEAVIQHSGATAVISFGSTLDEGIPNEAFAIDDVAVYVSDTEPGWKLAVRENFDNGTATGWSNPTVTTCSNMKMLGGYNAYAGTSVNKLYDLNTTPHSEVRVRAEYIPLDSWDGETAYMNAGGQIDTTTNVVPTRVWTTPVVNCFGKANVCGNAGYGDCEPLQIDETISDNSRYLRLMFGSTLDEPSTNESWGVKNIEIWVR